MAIDLSPHFYKSGRCDMDDRTEMLCEIMRIYTELGEEEKKALIEFITATVKDS